MKLVIGLGNPGREYAATRHNVGFDCVDQLAARLGWVNKPEQFDTQARTKFEALVMDGTISLASGGGGSEKLLLAKPMTYMNLSGRTVQAAMSFYQLTPADLIVVLDDIALPCGKIRIRPGGSSGGHNGLKDIERALGTSQYPRLRIGVDAPPPRVPQADYVLGKFTPDQRKQIDPALGRAGGAVVTWIDKGIEPAMSQFNAEEK
jgi:peptidyl-tRNA hydrolase, PTH1 family